MNLELLLEAVLSIKRSNILSKNRRRSCLQPTMLKYVHSYYPVPDNPRNLNVRYGIEVIEDYLDVTSCQDDNVVSEKEPSLVFDYGKREKDYGK